MPSPDTILSVLRDFWHTHPNRKRLIRMVQVLHELRPASIPAAVRPRPALSCPCVGGAMKILRTRILPHHKVSTHPDVAAGASGI